MDHTAYIGLGSNVGDHHAILRGALARMAASEGVSVLRVSRFMLTEPVGPPQGWYLNAVAMLAVELTPTALLARLQSIETALGRDRSREVRWGPRTCDLDIELFDDLVMDTETLTIPHPRMHEREFVLRPLVEIAPHALHPTLGKTAAELLAELEGKA